MDVGYSSIGSFYYGLFESYIYANYESFPISDPLGVYTTVLGGGLPANLGSVFVGAYFDGNTSHGFVARVSDTGSGITYTTLDDPYAFSGPAATNGGGTTLTGVDSNGDFVGYYYGADLAAHGFLYSQGLFTTVDDPLASLGANRGTIVSGVDGDEIVGSYFLADGSEHGFLDVGGSFTTLDDPAAAGGSTMATGVSDDIVVGTFTDSSHISHGFIYSNGVYTTVDDPDADGGDTQINGIVGQTFVGDYTSPGQQTHGMTVTFKIGPSISRSAGSQTITDQQTINPFATVRLDDDINPNHTMQATVTLSDPSAGALSSPYALSSPDYGAYDDLTGVYTVSGPLYLVEAAIDTLVFTPNVEPNPVSTTFTITLSDGALPAVSDDSTTVLTNWIDGGGKTINLGVGAPNAVAVHGTAGNWDTVRGTGASVYITAAQVSVLGMLNKVWFESGAGNAVSLYSTGGLWDTVYGSAGAVYLTSAQTSVDGAGDSIWFAGGSGNAASLYDTGGGWDAVYGSNGSIVLNFAQAVVTGGGDSIYFSNQGVNVASLADTGANWDFVHGSLGTVILTDAQASISGQGNVIWCATGASCLASLSNTGGLWDTVYGSGDLVILNAAQASVVGSGDAIHMSAGSTVSLYNTAGGSDAVNGSGATLILNGAQAKLTGSNDWAYVSGDSSLSLNGGSNTLVFEPALGVSSISGFAATDKLRLSASDWSSYSALIASGALAQHGADAVITRDGADSITLVGVQASSLTAAQFAFV